LRFGNFYGASKSVTKYLGYIPAVFDGVGTFDVTQFGGRISVDGSWYGRLSSVFLEFTTGSRTNGYILEVQDGRLGLAARYSYFWDWFSTWHRYFKYKNLGVAVTRSATGQIVATATSNAGEIYGVDWQFMNVHPPGGNPYQIILEPNTNYRLHYYLEFLGEAYRGYTASAYTGDAWFYGYTSNLTYAYLKPR